MKSNFVIIGTLILSSGALTACDKTTDPSTPKHESFLTDQWIGRWHGPEGTFLEITGTKGKYQITIQNLDGPSTYPATGEDEKIIFERNGVKESITPGNGKATGMKWLADKSTCLVIRTGEGFCKD